MEPLSWAEIFGQIFVQFTPVWIGLVLIFVLSAMFKRRLGLYGRLFDSTIGMIGLFIVLFWVLTAIFADLIITQDPLGQISGMKNKLPGTPVQGVDNSYYLLGGDNLARDVFSRVVMGARFVLSIAPAATLFAFMVGVTLGLPAGYFGKRLDTILSFIANMVLAFPVILLFYLLVTPEIRVTGIPTIMAAVLFLFPIAFLMMLFQSRYYTEPAKRLLYGSQSAERVCFSGVCKFAYCFSYCARDYAGYSNSRLCGGRPDTRRRVMVYHALGNSAQCQRPADCRFLLAYWLYDHFAGYAGLFWPWRQPGKPGLGVYHQ